MHAAGEFVGVGHACRDRGSASDGFWVARFDVVTGKISIGQETLVSRPEKEKGTSRIESNLGFTGRLF